MRIISGNFKGKKLNLPKDKNTRPLKDIVKESIFNLIQHSKKIKINIKNSSVLDLFSGSGSFGIECLSREAKKVTFLENYPKTLKVLEKNIRSLKEIENYEIIEKDCFDFVQLNKKIDLKFDIIFVDPPYQELKVNEVIEKVIDQNFLNKKGIMIIHRHKKDKLELSKKINIFEERYYGISKIIFCN